MYRLSLEHLKFLYNLGLRTYVPWHGVYLPIQLIILPTCHVYMVPSLSSVKTTEIERFSIQNLDLGPTINGVQSPGS